jgi:hypothetical protein
MLLRAGDLQPGSSSGSSSSSIFSEPNKHVRLYCGIRVAHICRCSTSCQEAAVSRSSLSYTAHRLRNTQQPGTHTGQYISMQKKRTLHRMQHLLCLNSAAATDLRVRTRTTSSQRKPQCMQPPRRSIRSRPSAPEQQPAVALPQAWPPLSSQPGLQQRSRQRQRHVGEAGCFRSRHKHSHLPGVCRVAVVPTAW